MKIQKRQEIEFFGTKTGNANSIALGYATETKNFGEVAVGVMNKSTAAKDPNSPKGVCVDSDATLFSVGCGGSGERKNALEVKGDGSVLISGEDGDINVADKIKQALDTDASIELVKSADSDLQYTLMVNNESRGSINIPKDQFLKNVTYDTEAKQLVFTFVTLDEEEHVERISINDLKDVYTAGDGINIDNNVISADFSSIMTAISDEKTQRETTDNEIKSTLDTKADKEDADHRLNYLQNRCFKFRKGGRVATPFAEDVNDFDRKIQQLNNNEEYTYADIDENLSLDEQEFIHDNTFNKTIKITKIDKEVQLDNHGDFFRTIEPLDLTHTFYLDNEKTGVVENLTQLTIGESDVFVNLPYVEVDDNLEDDDAPQYIYDATDSKWIEIVETYYISAYYPFNTEEPLDLTHELLYSNSSNLVSWTSVGVNSVALGYKADSTGGNSVALGCVSTAHGNTSTALGYVSTANGNCSTSLGSEIQANGNYSIALGHDVRADGISTVCIGCDIRGLSDACISIGNNVSSKATSSIAIGDYTNVSSSGSIGIGESSNVDGGSNSIGIGSKVVARSHNVIAIGFNSNARFLNSLALGAYSTTGGNYAIALGNNVSNTKSIFGVGFNGVNGIDMDRDDYGLYLKGFGGYDGTNLVVKSGDTEALNPDIKSVQQIINEKADASAIPIKVSDLYNDSEFLTQTYLDESFEHFRENYYDKTEIDKKGYLTEHQSLADYAKKTEIPDVSTKADLVDGKLKADQLPKLDNIAAATTTEDMITKFNALLTDLKAKGYMTADITA